MNRSVQKQFLANVVVGSALMLGVAVQAHAGVAPGKWRSDYRVQINGQDSSAVMAKLNAQMSVGLPRAVKGDARSGLNSIGNMGSTTLCITPAVAAALSTPRDFFNLFSKVNPRCTLVAGQTVGNTLSFTGRCDDAISYTGTVSGTVKLVSATQWSANMSGSGKFPDAVLATLNLPAKSVVAMTTTSNTTLLSNTCQ